MYVDAVLKKFKETENGTDLLISVPGKKLGEIITEKHVKKAELRIDDGRTISADQRKKAYATIRDVADYTGYPIEEQKHWLKFLYVSKTGADTISLSDCSMDEAREFINVVLEYAIENGVPLSEQAIARADDIGKYLYFCLKHSKCAVCGAKGEIHHEDAIGMGNDRLKVNDDNHKKICLCRKHHTIAHQLGRDRFQRSYKVYGIIFKEQKSER